MVLVQIDLIICESSLHTFTARGNNFSLPRISRSFHSEAGLYFRARTRIMVEEVSAMSTDDRTRDEALGLAEKFSKEGGIQARSNWERYKQIADKCREEGDVVMELYHCQLLADGLMLAAQNMGQNVEGIAGIMAGANATWKETTYWVHRWVKRVLEQKGGNNPLVKKPEFHAMRRNLVVACSHQLRLLRFDEVIETADLFSQVRPAEVTEEELQVQLMKGVARYFLGLTAAVKDFDVAVRLAQKLNCKELEAKAWYGKYSSLRETDRWQYAEDIQDCLARYEELVSQVPNSRADVEALFGTHPMKCDHQPVNIPETETIQRLEKELAEEQSPILLAEKHFSLGRLFLKQKEFLKAEENLKKAIERWCSTPVIKDSGGVHQVTAQLQMAPAFQLLQLCLVEQVLTFKGLPHQSSRFRGCADFRSASLLMSNTVALEKKLLDVSDHCPSET